MSKKKQPDKTRIKELMDMMTKHNQIMKVAFTTENTYYKAIAHDTLTTPPWYLRNDRHE